MTAAIQVPDQDLGKVQAFLAEQNIPYTVLKSPLLAPLQNNDEHKFLCGQLAARYGQKIKGYEDNIAVFEQKYGMGFDEFREKFHQITAFDMFEKEDDDMDWDFYVKLKQLLGQKLEKINSGM